MMIVAQKSVLGGAKQECKQGGGIFKKYVQTKLFLKMPQTAHGAFIVIWNHASRMGLSAAPKSN